jgi:hypothetical protein
MTLKRLRVGSVAALLSLSVHGFLFVPLLLGHSAGKVSPGASSLTWVAVAEPAGVVHDELSPVVHLQSRPVEIPTSEIDLGSVDADAPPARVWRMGAITARIQNAWTFPRAALASDFNCRVRIRQGDAGSVEEVEFESCDDIEALRASLIRAIERAAPLPLLDDDHRMGTDIRLHFAAYAASPGGRHTVVEPGAAMSP